MTWVLVTGATGGIGADAARAFAKAGMRVIATGRDPRKLEERSAGMQTVVLDVCDAASVDRARARVDEITAGHGVDVLVNNAGYGEMGPIETFEGSRVRAMFETNVLGAARVIRAFVPAMRARGSGRVIQVSSVLGRITIAAHGIYGATKHALEAMSDALRMELAPFGVRVAVIEPGSVDTGFSEIAFGGLDDGGDPEWAEIVSRVRGLERMNARMEIPAARVSDVILCAATEPSPSPRYVVPFNATAQIVASRVLPSPIYEAIVRRAMGVRGARGNTPAGPDRRVLITGAAGGIGRAASIRLAKHGLRVIATDRDEAALAKLAKGAREQRLPIETRTLDVSDERSIASVAKAVGPIDALVNNAGYAELGPIELVNDEAWRAQLEVNVYGMLALTRAFAPAMRRARRGSIVNVSSIAGIVSFPFMGVYCASKFALEALTDALRLELGAFGVDVSAVQPSFIRSGFAARAKQTVERYADYAGAYAPAFDRMETVVGRLDAVGGEPEDVARAILRALTDASPAPRYRAPFTAEIAARTIPFVPDAITDRALARVFETHRLAGG